MVEGSVTEVDEATVLTDPTGMHIGAGPCMLIYSRSVTDEQRWDMDHPRYHEHFMSNVLQCNAQYFEKLPDEVKARIETTWGSADAFIRRGMPSQAVPHPMSPTARSASPSTAMSVDLTRDTPPRGPRPEKPGHAASPSHTTSPSSHRNSLRKTSSASRDTIMRDPPLQHRDASVRDVPPHQAREPRDLPPHQALPREGSMSRVEGPHGPREASMGRSSPSLSRDASMSNP
ncbi:hypothetical protein K523DRAFT_236427 [Schizophyllum commune Tattone D]|nr:hypothetical protein K523DRAFT_236427 [Schizophyllum commune Tattone D]